MNVWEISIEIKDPELNRREHKIDLRIRLLKCAICIQRSAIWRRRILGRVSKGHYVKKLEVFKI